MTEYEPLKTLACGCVGALLLGSSYSAQSAVYHVTSNADSGAGTLRTAIVSANLNPGPDTIFFNLPLSDLDITMITDLPEITDAVSLVGATQPGFTKVPLVTLRSGGSPNGLRIAATSSSVSDLRVVGFQTGIRVTAPSCAIASCYVLSNAVAGIRIESHGNVVQRCYVAANEIGVYLLGDSNTLFGNFIGIHPSTGMANGNTHGVFVATDHNFIGGTGADEGNVISGNISRGLSISWTSSSNSIRGNLIGTDASGTAAVPNAVGISIAGNANTVGGVKDGSRNIVSGNTTDGIKIVGVGQPAERNKIEANYIGTDRDGLAAVPNRVGITIDGGLARSNTVGNALSMGRNIVSGNTESGIVIEHAHDTSVKGNYIGTDISGTVALPNGAHGVQVVRAAGTVLGGTTAEAGNTVSGNANAGFLLRGPSLSGTTVEGNRIGTRANGTQALPNGGAGILLTGASALRIGGTTAGAGNTVSANGQDGIYLEDSHHVVIQGNRVGTTASGLLALGNALTGIALLDSPSNTIGGVTAAAGNIVSGNWGYGIALTGPGNVVQGNVVGLGADGETPVPNGMGGLLVSHTREVVVGGDLFAGGGNRISANGGVGVWISASSDCELIGNVIGGHPVGAGFGGNAGAGIYITGVASNNTMGGDVWSEGNTISYNGAAGIAVGINASSTNTVGNRIDWNWIHHNGGLGIDLGNDGRTPNDFGIGGDGDVGPNNLQNYPVITNVIAEGANIRLQGYLKSGVNQSYKINVYGNPQFDPSGYGQGEIMIGSTNLSTAPLDTGYFDLLVPAPDPLPDYYSATATHAARGDTSEFSHFAMLDSDGDGMPDGWEERYFGHPTGGDPDGHDDDDNATNLEEFLADTDPTDGDDYLRVNYIDAASSASPSEVVTEVRCMTSAYRRYRIELTHSGGLPDGLWMGGSSGYVAGTGSELIMQQSRPSTNPATHFRIKTRLP